MPEDPIRCDNYSEFHSSYWDLVSSTSYEWKRKQINVLRRNKEIVFSAVEFIGFSIECYPQNTQKEKSNMKHSNYDEYRKL